MKNKFKNIIVNDIDYTYSINLKTNKIVIISENVKQILDLPIIVSSSWRGKKYHGPFGTREVRSIILKLQNN